MATLITLRRRIKATQNVSKTTRAMQMIAASKLKKAQDAALAGRPYVEKLGELAKEVSLRTDDANKHPYMKLSIDTNKTLLIAIAPDKGLCGGLITNLLREFFTYNKTDKDNPMIVVGKKLENQVIKLPNEVIATFHFGTTLPKFDVVYPLITLINDYYLTGKVSSVKVLYTDFVSFFNQTPRVVQLLPIALPLTNDEAKNQLDNQSSEMLYEPKLSEMAPELLKHYVEMTLFQYFLETYLSEQAARMLAMQNATNNAKDIIDALKLEYNKTRQAKITGELLDIIGGRSESIQ
jgi:F-type H+-transporting ATPase subunit gamma